MSIWAWISLICILSIAYPYLGYPLLLLVWPRKSRPMPVAKENPAIHSASIVIAAHNEESSIRRRLEELTSLAQSAPIPTDVILVSDGSTDGTARTAREVQGVTVLVLEKNRGKAVALNEGVGIASGDVIIFADARQTWSPNTVSSLLRNFADPLVGAASGELFLTAESGVNSGVGLYWRFEKWIRKQESEIHSTIGVTGAVAAVRRSLFRPLPAGTILDDVYWPLRVAMDGYRVVYESCADAYDHLPVKGSDEFRRKRRTLAGNFQLLRLLPETLSPWRNTVFLQFISHKIARLMVPWALLILLAATLFGPATWTSRILLVLQFAFYGAAIAGIALGSSCHWRVLSTAGSFLLLNAAAWSAFWVAIFGTGNKTWQKSSYVHH
jgi:cellulose synthase/poly-beta-1,6-N-acetylglucosamine synthase-like glycosyltransferase